MSRNAKILIDLAVLAAVYGIWLLPKWRPLGRRTLAVYTLMYGCLASIALFTLMNSRLTDVSAVLWPSVCPHAHGAV